MRGLAGKAALITGAGRGIGRAIAERLVRDGVSVVLVDLDRALVEQTRREMLAEGPSQSDQPRGRIFAFGCDVTDQQAVAHLFAEAAAAVGGPIQLLVNNVGGGRVKRPALQMTGEAMLSSYNSNVVTLVVVTSAFVQALGGKPGAVVNLSSSAAVRPKGGRIQYTGAKAAVSALTQSLAIELAEHQVRVNAVCPGPTLTDEIRSRFADPALRPAEEQRLAKIPLKRMAEPAEIADAVAFLLSQEAGYITGALLPVDGGYTVAT